MLLGYLSGGQHCVFVQTEDGVGHHGLVWQEAAAHHLQRRRKSRFKVFLKKENKNSPAAVQTIKLGTTKNKQFFFFYERD